MIGSTIQAIAICKQSAYAEHFAVTLYVATSIERAVCAAGCVCSREQITINQFVLKGKGEVAGMQVLPSFNAGIFSGTFFEPIASNSWHCDVSL